MNASQRRISRRAILAAFPIDTNVFTPTGTVAKVVGLSVNERLIGVKYRNNRRDVFHPRMLSRV